MAFDQAAGYYDRTRTTVAAQRSSPSRWRSSHGARTRFSRWAWAPVDRPAPCRRGPLHARPGPVRADARQAGGERRRHALPARQGRCHACPSGMDLSARWWPGTCSIIPVLARGRRRGPAGPAAGRDPDRRPGGWEGLMATCRVCSGTPPGSRASRWSGSTTSPTSTSTSASSPSWAVPSRTPSSAHCGSSSGSWRRGCPRGRGRSPTRTSGGGGERTRSWAETALGDLDEPRTVTRQITWRAYRLS